jgi:hypothetical protein
MQQGKRHVLFHVIHACNLFLVGLFDSTRLQRQGQTSLTGRCVRLRVCLVRRSPPSDRQGYRCPGCLILVRHRTRRGQVETDEVNCESRIKKKSTTGA